MCVLYMCCIHGAVFYSKDLPVGLRPFPRHLSHIALEHVGGWKNFTLISQLAEDKESVFMAMSSSVRTP